MDISRLPQIPICHREPYVSALPARKTPQVRVLFLESNCEDGQFWELAPSHIRQPNVKRQQVIERTTSILTTRVSIRLRTGCGRGIEAFLGGSKMEANWLDAFNGQHVAVLTQAGSEEKSDTGTLQKIADGWLQVVKDNGEMILIPSTAIRLVKLLDMTQRIPAIDQGPVGSYPARI